MVTGGVGVGVAGCLVGRKIRLVGWMDGWMDTVGWGRAYEGDISL